MTDVFSRITAGLPLVRSWVDDVVNEHAARAIRASELDFGRLDGYFSEAVLQGTRVASVDRIPIPPLSSFGLPEFAAVEQMAVAGITFKDLCLIHQSLASESVHFHELVHAVQWRALGVDDYMLTYAVGLLQYGYAQNPLEVVAYDLQSQFDRHLPAADAEAIITSEARRARDAAHAQFRQHGFPVPPPGGSS